MTSYYTPQDRRTPITPALALRVAALGFVALALFAIIFFRLWFLQVLAGDDYLVQANQNRVRDIPIAAPRGDVVDRRGRTLIDSRLANVVLLRPDSLPDSVRSDAARWGQDAARLARRWRQNNPRSRREPPLPPIPPAPPRLERRHRALGKVLDMRAETIQRRVVQSLAVLPYASVRLRIDVPRSVIAYLQERKAAFPGVAPDTVYLRRYPQNTLAAQLLGNVGEVDPEELERSRYRGVQPGTVVGKSGVEYSYDRYLRGRAGAERLQVDSTGNFVGELARARRDPVPGRRIQLSLDAELQRTGQRALQRAVALANGNGNPAKAGAFVAMNPRSGAILGLGSVPSFDPEIFTKPISDADYRALNSEATGAPLFDRATAGTYPTGSVFKPITALAAFGSGKVPDGFSVDDNGCMKIGVQSRCNAGKAAYGSVDLPNAMKVSSDIYFYELGIRTNSARTQIIQSMARKLGLGRATGIDVPGSTPGLIPDWRWRRDIAEREERCRRKRDIPLGQQFSVYTAAARGCGISDMRPWSIGDNVSLAVGQGDMQASPLQMAVAYSAIVERGRVPRPHVGLEVEDSAGRLIQRIQPGAARRVELDESTRTQVLEGLRLATTAPKGTSTEVWEGWDHERFPVFGKTGTAERPPRADQSWYVSWIRDNTKPRDPGIVIAVTIEEGGFGAESAAPAARLIASRYFGVQGKLVEGDSRTR